MTTALLLTGGVGHPPEATGESLAAILADVGLATEATDDIDAGLAALDPTRHTLVVVNALWWTRPGSAPEPRIRHLDDAGRRAIGAWHADGRPILALHTGLLSFDDWPGWAELLGGAWVAGTSHHGPIAPLAVRTCAGGFEVTDECYQGIDLAGDVAVVASSDAGDPLAWRRTGSGRVVVDLLGHDARSLDAAGHRALLARELTWLLEDR